MLRVNKGALVLKGLFYVAAINVASFYAMNKLNTEMDNDNKDIRSYFSSKPNITLDENNKNLGNFNYQSLSNTVVIKKDDLQQKVEYTSNVLNNLHEELGKIRSALQEIIEKKRELKPYIVKEEDGEEIIEVDSEIIKIADLSVNTKFVQSLVKDVQKGLQNKFSQEYFKKNPRAAFSIALGACPAIRENVDKLILSLGEEGFDYLNLSKLNNTW